MTNLYQQVAGSGHSILLSDRDGVLLNYVGDPLFTTAAASTGLQAGVVWTERSQGTNGIGTCLEEQRPLVIHRQEHFCTKNIGLTCSAAPIFGPTGELVGVLDASSESRRAQQHTMVLVNMAAHLIENRLFQCRMRENFIMRFHSRAESVSTLGEGVIAFDAAGQLRAAKRSALFQLGTGSVDDIVGHPIHEMFTIRADEMFTRARGHPADSQPLRDTQRERRFYVTFQLPFDQLAPSQRGAPHPARAPRSVATSSLTCQEHGDARMRRNVR